MQAATRSIVALLCMLAACPLGEAFAFVAPSAGRGAVASLSVGSSSSAPAAFSPVPRPPAGGRRRVVMLASDETRDASVAIYKNYLGGKRWEKMEQPESSAAAVFDEICDVYGEENAVKMVKAVPACLGYNPTNFRATFEAFSEVFSPEDTKGMVTRNPTLMGLRPDGFGGAINAKSDTMTMSYFIAYTRPVGPLLLFGLFFCISIPFMEASTGMPREELFSMVVSKLTG